MEQFPFLWHSVDTGNQSATAEGHLQTGIGVNACSNLSGMISLFTSYPNKIIRLTPFQSQVSKLDNELYGHSNES